MSIFLEDGSPETERQYLCMRLMYKDGLDNGILNIIYPEAKLPWSGTFCLGDLRGGGGVLSGPGGSWRILAGPLAASGVCSSNDMAVSREINIYTYLYIFLHNLSLILKETPAHHPFAGWSGGSVRNGRRQEEGLPFFQGNFPFC
jgi:hypothetical protein